MVGEIDKNLKPKEPNIYLCKPNRQRIALLSEAKNKVVNYKYNNTHEFTFTLPYKVKKHNQTVHNEHIELIRGRYLLEVNEEYFIIDKFEKLAEYKTELLNVHAYHLPYELRDKSVRAYKGVKKLREALTDTLLKQTDWQIDYIDGEVDTQYRVFDVTEQTLLQFIYEAAKNFNVVVYWNSKDKTVSFYKQENLGNNKGLFINDKKYLKQIMESIDYDSVCTRLKCYGHQGLTFNDISPIGQNYIENFSAFMYPYEETIIDEENDIYEVISHSYYMSDGLCHNIIKYNNFIESKLGDFEDLLQSKSLYESQLLTLNNQLKDLEIELAIILDNLDTANANGLPTGDIISQKNNKVNQINDKRDEIYIVEKHISDINDEILALQQEFALENHFTPEQIVERNSYIIERTFTNDAYLISQDLYDAGVEALNNLIYPPIDINIDIVNFLKVVNCQNDWDKLGIGDIITFSYPNFGIHIQAKILALTIDYENNNINLNIGNYKRMCKDEDYLREMLYKTTTTSSQIDMNKIWWDISQENKTYINQIINNAWDANKNAVVAGNNNQVEIGIRGIIIKDPDDPMNYLVAKNGVLAITNDGGNTWKNAITKSGIAAEHIFGSIIIAQEGNFDQIRILDDDGEPLAEIGKYLSQDGETEKRGIKIAGGALEIVGAGTDGFLVLGADYNNLVIDSENGITVTRSDSKVRILINATDGIKIQNSSDNGTTWLDVLSFDENGNGIFKGIVDAQDYQINGVSILNEDNKIKEEFVDVVVSNTVITETLYADKGNIVDLTVNKLDTSIKVDNYKLRYDEDFATNIEKQQQSVSDVNYIKVYEQHIEFHTGSVKYDEGGVPLTEQATDDKGRPLYWVDDTHMASTYEPNDLPVMIYQYDETVKLSISFRRFGETYEPYIILGEGIGSTLDPDRGKAFIHKDAEGLLITYKKADGTDVYLRLGENGISLSHDVLSALNFYSNGFIAEYGNTQVGYRWTKDVQGRITQLENIYTSEVVPVTWNGGAI